MSVLVWRVWSQTRVFRFSHSRGEGTGAVVTTGNTSAPHPAQLTICTDFYLTLVDKTRIFRKHKIVSLKIKSDFHCWIQIHLANSDCR